MEIKLQQLKFIAKEWGYNKFKNISSKSQATKLMTLNVGPYIFGKCRQEYALVRSNVPCVISMDKTFKSC